MADDPAQAGTASGDWPQEPDGFNNLKFGWNKEQVERYCVFESYGIVNDGMADQNLPFPACGNTHFAFAETPIAASLTFTPSHGLHCIQGTFPSSAFERIKSAFIDLYGQPHESSSEVPTVPEGMLKNIPKEALWYYTVKVDSLLWYSSSVWISLTCHQAAQAQGALWVATASYMRNRSGWNKMVEKAKARLPRSVEVYRPPDGWSQEPGGFGDLNLGMTKREIEQKLQLGKRTDLKYENVLYEVPLKLAEIEIAGTLTFNHDRLVTVSGEFERSHWDSVTAAFMELYGKPHVHRREEIFEQGMMEILDWSGDRIWIRLIDFPDGKDPRFHFQQSLSGALARGARLQTSIEVSPVRVPREPVKIETEHRASSLVLHLPDGTTLDYPRADRPTISTNVSWERKADGRFAYHLDLNTADISGIQFGEGRLGPSDESFSQPDGWMGIAGHWLRTGAADSESARFSIESTKLPGPVPFSVSNKKEPQSGRSIPWTLPRKFVRPVGEVLVEQTPFLNNSFVIGPAIPRGSAEGDLRNLARIWVHQYGFHFLEPLLDSMVRLSVVVERLHPMSSFEEKIVECLKGAIQ